MLVGDALARWVYNNEPVKFAAIELVPEDGERRARDAVRPPQLERHRDRRHPDPGPRVDPLGSGRRHEHRGPGARTPFPADDQPTIAEVNVVHLAWDVMVGLGTFLSPARLWYALSWLFRRDMPKSKLFLWIAASAGVLVGDHDGGGLGRHRGRSPAVDRATTT